MEDDPPAKVKDDRSVKFNIPSPEQDEEEESLSSTHQRNASLDPSILSSMQEDLDDFQPQSRHRSMTHVMTEGQQPVIFRRSSSFKGNKRLSMKRRSAAVRKSQRFSAMNADNQVCVCVCVWVGVGVGVGVWVGVGVYMYVRMCICLLPV